MKINATNIKKGLRYLKHYGFKEFLIRLEEKQEQEAVPYDEWYQKMKVTEQESDRQRKESRKWNNAPKISVVVPLYETPERFLREMIESVQASSYENWELCLADGTPSADKEANADEISRKAYALHEIVREYQKKDCRLTGKGQSRIVYKKLEQNEGIAGNTNQAIAMVTGDYIAFLDHDDVITPDALYEMAARIVSGQEKKQAPDMLYSDEDKTDSMTTKFMDPHFKPDFNLDLLRSNNYITHFLVVSRKLLEKAGGIRSDYDGAQDYDFVLRCTEQAEKIEHIAKILYHWRVHELSTAGGGGTKDYAADAGKRALEDHLSRLGVKASVETTQYFGFYRIRYELTEKPLVSIIIPNKDEIESLEKCLRAIQKSTYSNYEVIIVENNSEKEETFSYYKKIESDQIHVVFYPDGFNYSKLNNFGVAHAKGDYYVLMNNDIEVLHEDWIEQMLSNCERKEVGIVGARLYYPDNTIQHAGLVIGIGGSLRGIGANLYQGMRRERSGYLHRAAFQMDYSAVTAALMMVKKEVYEQVHGFEEELSVAFNDVDFCLRVRELGYLIVYDPLVEAYHYESKSRGAEDSPEKVARFQTEIEFMRNRWENLLKKGDPNYNINFSRVRADYSLGDPEVILRQNRK